MLDLSTERFTQMVREAIDTIPAELSAKMDNVNVFVEDLGPRPTVLGLYQGYPLPRRAGGYGAGASRRGGGAHLPDRITIYRQPILACCATEAEVLQKVRVVVIHEVAHHFGIGEARLRELGWV